MFRVYERDEILPSYVGIITINHEIRIPSINNQDSMEVKAPGVFFWSVLFGKVKLPLQRLSDLQIGDKKGHFESPGRFLFLT